MSFFHHLTIGCFDPDLIYPWRRIVVQRALTASEIEAIAHAAAEALRRPVDLEAYRQHTMAKALCIHATPGPFSLPTRAVAGRLSQPWARACNGLRCSRKDIIPIDPELPARLPKESRFRICGWSWSWSPWAWKPV